MQREKISKITDAPTYCSLCGVQTSDPCVRSDRRIRDASDCENLNKLPRSVETGLPIGDRLVLGDDLILNREPEEIPLKDLKKYAPTWKKKTLA